MMKPLSSGIVLLFLVSGSLALPPSQTQTRGPARIKQTTPISSSNIDSSSSSSTSVTPVTIIEQRTKNADHGIGSTLPPKKTSHSAGQETAATSDQQKVSSSSPAKETRESIGKTRPQIKLNTNYTSVGEVSLQFSLFIRKQTIFHENSACSV